jgi:ABC-type phosphate/phosphonate transport system ATPase subunit
MNLRTKEINDIFELINTGNNVSLIGASGHGKTWLLRQIHQLAITGLILEQRTPIYLTLQAVENDQEFFSYLCKDINCFDNYGQSVCCS